MGTLSKVAADLISEISKVNTRKEYDQLHHIFKKNWECGMFSGKTAKKLRRALREARGRLRGKPLTDSTSKPTLEMISPIIKKLKDEHKGKNYMNVVSCPACEGKLHVSHNGANGHTMGGCATDECPIGWIE